MENLAARIEIKEAGADDAQLISVLATATFYEAYFEQDESRNLANYIREAFDLEVIRTDLTDPDATFYIVYLDTKACGFAKLVKNSTADGVTTRNTIELKRIYILERVLGKGVGSILLNHCLDESRRQGFETLWLGVWDENLKAQRFYDRHGFKQVGSVSMPYGAVVGTNFVMEKKL